MIISDKKRKGYKMKPENFSVIERKICDLLTAEGYTFIDARKVKVAANLNINNIEFLRGEKERIYILSHKPVTEAVV